MSSNEAKVMSTTETNRFEYISKFLATEDFLDEKIEKKLTWNKNNFSSINPNCSAKIVSVSR